MTTFRLENSEGERSWILWVCRQQRVGKMKGPSCALSVETDRGVVKTCVANVQLAMATGRVKYVRMSLVRIMTDVGGNPRSPQDLYGSMPAMIVAIV